MNRRSFLLSALVAPFAAQSVIAGAVKRQPAPRIRKTWYYEWNRVLTSRPTDIGYTFLSKEPVKYGTVYRGYYTALWFRNEDWLGYDAHSDHNVWRVKVAKVALQRDGFLVGLTQRVTNVVMRLIPSKDGHIPPRIITEWDGPS